MWTIYGLASAHQRLARSWAADEWPIVLQDIMEARRPLRVQCEMFHRHLIKLLSSGPSCLSTPAVAFPWTSSPPPNPRKMARKGESDADFDFVATSQPLEDGEEDWHSYYGLTPIPKSPPSPPLASLSRGIPEPVARSDTDTTASDTRPRRAHLIRRAPPCSPPRPLPLGTVSRSP
ncbi:hypothetical protein DFH09DRAFT_1220003, partial [Mycena vulgaris]